ncbi:MAG TPA: serine hydrolase domain-containing protein [Solirubrobacteraceae bacterium]|nr:serine hydrolase domain-containing protein [Solirubrobacteraceae bacterium]
MSRRPLLLVAAVAALLAAPVATASPTHAELDRAVDRVVSAGAPGAIALVRDGHRTVRAAGGFADRRSRRPLRPGDRFRVGSNTKTFVATVLLQLAGEGRLALEDTVERWLPGLVPGGGAITVRQLLNHTSGLPDYAPEDDDSFIRQVLADRRRKWTPRELVGIAMARPPLFAPGAAWAYSNTGYILLGLIAEAASGRPLATELRERIFAPLHLRGTTYATGPRIAGRHGHGYSRFGARRLYDITAVDQSWAGAAGAIVSRARDLARFQRALLGGRLLRRDLLAQMRTTVPVGGQGYGFGLIRTRLPCGTFWGHGGETLGYLSYADTRPRALRQVMIAVTADQSVFGRRTMRALDRLRELAYCG